PKEFVDYWSKHISLGCGFMFRDNEPFGGLLRINYNSFSLKDDNFLSGKNSLYGNVSVSGGMLKILSFSSNIFISLTSTENKFQIYFFGGGGFYKLKYERIKISTNLGDYYVPEDLKVKSGVNIGTEIEARIYKNFGLNLQCLFHTIFFQESENFNYITLQLGLVLHSDD
nr:hypothetical protein [candidate division KSB1 bacterium]